MDLKDLRSRLDSIKKSASEADLIIPENNSTENSAVEKPATERLLLDHGWKKTAEMVFERETVLNIKLPEVVSNILLDENAPEAGIPASQFVFYDTETTGLSAGAGNIVFLTGFGEALPGTDIGVDVDTAADFRISQIFLSDFPGEPAFLERLKDFISPEKIYVSYNGKSFDANILRTRFTMNAMQADFGYQLDLLYSSRRLWKNIIGCCSLGDIERRVLDKHRELDVPGFMVPDLYFDFIRGGRWDTIEGVLAHHLEDIASLAELLTVHEQLFNEAGNPPEVRQAGSTDYYDSLGLASLLLNKKPLAAAAVLTSAWEHGNHRAGIELSLIHKRAGHWGQAVQIWENLWHTGRSIFAGTELSKYYEHRAHRPAEALKLTEDMLASERFRIIQHLPDLEKRHARLKRLLNDKLE